MFGRLGAAVAFMAAMSMTTPAAGGEMHVTVYNSDLALIKEVRGVDMPKGTGEFSFSGVPSRIDPTSVRLSPGKGGDIAILEQNYRYDLVNRDKLMERYLDKPVRVVTKHERVHEGILKSTQGGLVLEGDDGVVIVSPDEIADLSLPEIPEGLMTRPTLVWKVANDGATKRDVEIAYLTGGMTWHAEYVAAVDADEDVMHLDGWVSIENHSGATFPDAHLKVVAGDVNRVTDHRMPMMAKGGRATFEMAQDGGFDERSFFEYHIYDLGRRTTVADREVKQIRLIEDRTVPFERVYVFEPTRVGDKIQVKMEFENKKDNGLGIALPAGKFRVYQEDADDALEFAGEDRIDHTPRDEKVSVLLGNAFDLVGEREVLESKRISQRLREEDVRIKLRNRKESDEVVILVREHPAGDWDVSKSSHASEKKNARDLEFKIPVKAGEEVVLTYSVRSRF